MECVRCIAIDSSIHPAAYCSKQCQTSHWEEHRRACILRMRLRRAADLVKTLWLAFRLSGQVNCITKVWRQDETLHVQEAIGEYPFPNLLVTTPHDKERLLTHRACFDAFFATHPLIATLLKGKQTIVGSRARAF